MRSNPNRVLRSAVMLPGLILLYLLSAPAHGLAEPLQIEGDRWLEIDLYWFDREDIDRSGSRPQESPGARLHGGTGREDVIHQQKVLACERRRNPAAVGAGSVAPPAPRLELRLRRTLLDLDQ